jgi:DNA-binding winged helix-turn-helix (wHTH) protein
MVKYHHKGRDLSEPKNGRIGGLGSEDNIVINGFRLDRRAGWLFRLDQNGAASPVAFGSRAVNPLALLAVRQGELVSKDATMKAVWPRRVVEEANLNVQLGNVCTSLEQRSCYHAQWG